MRERIQERKRVKGGKMKGNKEEKKRRAGKTGREKVKNVSGLKTKSEKKTDFSH